MSQNKQNINIGRRKRGPVFRELTVYGHHYDEYQLMIDEKDSVLSLKYMLAPLIDAKAEHIGINYNTERLFKDNEIIYETQAFDNSIRIMWWLQLENPNPNETKIIRSITHLVRSNPLWPTVGHSFRKVKKKKKN